MRSRTKGRAAKGLSQKRRRMMFAVRDWSRYLKDVHQDCLKIAAETFVGHGRQGVSWAVLSDNTKAAKQVFGYPADPLVRNGSLRNSITKAGRGHYVKITKTRLRFGSNVRTQRGGRYLWSIHHHGTPQYTINARTPKGMRFIVAANDGPKWITRQSVKHPGIPKRPVLVIRAGDRKRWRAQALAYATKSMQARAEAKSKT